MTTRDRILAKHRAGYPLTEADRVVTITDLAELDAYRIERSRNGTLTTDATAAIRDRMDALQGGRG